MKSLLSSQPRIGRRSRPLCAGVLCSVLSALATHAGPAFALPPGAADAGAGLSDAGAPDAAAPDAAAPETTFPERPTGLFPSCASEEDTFCIESATKDDTSILGSSYVIAAWFLDPGSINWTIGFGSQYGELPAEDLGSTFHFVIRTGDLQPLYTYAIADHFRLTAAGDAQSGYRIGIEATPTTIHWNFEISCTTLSCGDDQTQAVPSASGRRLMGNTQNMALWGDDERNRFGGTYVATNAQALSTVVLFEPSPTPRWYLDLANPHLDVDGDPVTGSFTAWVPPGYFEALDTTASAAIEAGFDVTRTEGGVAAPLEATITLDHGGTLVRVESVSYSAPRITVAQSSEGAGGSESTPGASGSGGSGSAGGSSAGSGMAGSGSAGSNSSGGSGAGGAGAAGNAGAGSVDTGTAGAAGSSAAPTPDVTAGSGGSTGAPSSGRKRRSGGCALGAPSSDPIAALAAAGLVALLGTRRRARSSRGR